MDVYRKKNVIRKIIHIDMDAFFASVEQRDNLSLKGKPVAVGGTINRGVVAAASYEARKYGVRSAMPIVTALKLCPHLILTPPRFDVYKSVSDQISDIFHEYTDFVEPLSLDEAFLDVSLPNYDNPSATRIAAEIKKRISETTHLTASAGVSYNKFLAKVASDYKKPDGLFVITPEQAIEFIEQLPIDQFFGVGKVSAEKFHKLGIYNGKQLKELTLNDLNRWFGKAGQFYFEIVRGIDNRPVISERELKSVGAEDTFESDLTDKELLKQHLNRLAEKVWKRATNKNLFGRTICIKVKFFDFNQITRSKTESEQVTDFSTFAETVQNLFDQSVQIEKPIRLLGVSITNFDENKHKDEQLQLNLK
jgi:DNA polymerase IV